MITLDDAITWLNQFDQKKSFLSDSSSLLLERIKAAQVAWDLGTLRVRIPDLIAFCDSLKRELEPAEARLKCARAFFYWVTFGKRPHCYARPSVNITRTGTTRPLPNGCWDTCFGSHRRRTSVKRRS